MQKKIKTSKPHFAMTVHRSANSEHCSEVSRIKVFLRSNVSSFLLLLLLCQSVLFSHGVGTYQRIHPLAIYCVHSSLPQPLCIIAVYVRRRGDREKPHHSFRQQPEGHNHFSNNSRTEFDHLATVSGSNQGSIPICNRQTAQRAIHLRKSLRVVRFQRFPPPSKVAHSQKQSANYAPIPLGMPIATHTAGIPTVRSQQSTYLLVFSFVFKTLHSVFRLLRIYRRHFSFNLLDYSPCCCSKMRVLVYVRVCMRD